MYTKTNRKRQAKRKKTTKRQTTTRVNEEESCSLRSLGVRWRSRIFLNSSAVWLIGRSLRSLPTFMSLPKMCGSADDPPMILRCKSDIICHKYLLVSEKVVLLPHSLTNKKLKRNGKVLWWLRKKWQIRK